MRFQILIILFLVFISCKNITDKENKQIQSVVDSIELAKKYNKLKTHIGEENIQIDYSGETFNEIQITHIPTGKIQFGNEHKTQIENAVQALEKLKLELLSESNSKLVEFLENPIDLQSFKNLKITHNATTVSKGEYYHFHPKNKDSVFYKYNYPIENFSSPKKINQVLVFKHGKNKHTYDDKTEILIELMIFNKDSDLKKANLVGHTITQLETKFGSNYLILNNRIIYSNKNRALIIVLKDSIVKSFNYIKLSTEKIDNNLISEIIK